MNIDEIFPGVFSLEGRLCTKNLVTGQKVYSENLIRVGGSEYRTWNPNRSKLSAALLNGLKTFPFSSGSKVLYLGASSGTTCSHLSDIMVNGVIYAVEFAQRPMRDLVSLSKTRGNIIPILADARFPYEYSNMIIDVDCLYQDVAQAGQAEIFLKNADIFLDSGQYGVICVKGKSIDSVGNIDEVFENEISKLKSGFEIIQTINLDPYEKDHMFVLCRKK